MLFPTGVRVVLVNVPQHHQVPNVLLPVELTLGEVSGRLALADFIVDLDRFRSQYYASGLG